MAKQFCMCICFVFWSTYCFAGSWLNDPGALTITIKQKSGEKQESYELPDIIGVDNDASTLHSNTSFSSREIQFEYGLFEKLTILGKYYESVYRDEDTHIDQDVAEIGVRIPSDDLAIGLFIPGLVKIFVDPFLDAELPRELKSSTELNLLHSTYRDSSDHGIRTQFSFADQIFMPNWKILTEIVLINGYMDDFDYSEQRFLLEFGGHNYAYVGYEFTDHYPYDRDDAYFERTYFLDTPLFFIAPKKARLRVSRSEKIYRLDGAGEDKSGLEIRFSLDF